MKLPNSDQAYIEAQKLTDYLLSEDHPEGQAKARYFRSIGFNEKNIDLFRQRLIDLAQSEPVTVSYTTPHGEKYVTKGNSSRRMGTRPQFALSGLSIWVQADLDL